MRRKFSIKQSLRQAAKDSLLARTDGFTVDGKIAGDYLASGRDPKLPRQTSAHIAKVISKQVP